uniref:Uncharacterized protein n=1 Tax=Glossina austeni TaxID=7395 RepID=A0A1A9V4M5_GLOAU
MNKALHKALDLKDKEVNRSDNANVKGKRLCKQLLGFQSKIFYCKPCNFMYSDERYILESKSFFRTLWERCRARDEVAIRYVNNRNVTNDAMKGSYYSLLPKDGVKVVYLFYTSYARHVDFKKWNSLENRASNEEVAICEKLVRKLRLKYNPSLLSDPEMDHLQSKLLTLAFDQKFEILGSQHFPDPQSQDTVIARLLSEFEETFGYRTGSEESCHLYSPLASTKSKAAKLVVENLNKKDYVIQMMNNRALDPCTNQQLMQTLDEHFNKSVPKNS